MAKDHLQIDITPSAYQCVLLVLTHAGAISGILVATLGIHYQVAFTFVVSVSLIISIRRYGLLTDPLSVVSVLYRDEAWHLSCRSDESDGEILASLDLPVFVASFLVVLNFKDARGRSYPVAIFPDAVNGTQMRHCRIFLKYHPNLGGTRVVSVASSNKSG